MKDERYAIWLTVEDAIKRIMRDGDVEKLVATIARWTETIVLGEVSNAILIAADETDDPNVERVLLTLNANLCPDERESRP